MRLREKIKKDKVTMHRSLWVGIRTSVEWYKKVSVADCPDILIHMNTWKMTYDGAFNHDSKYFNSYRITWSRILFVVRWAWNAATEFPHTRTYRWLSSRYVVFCRRSHGSICTLYFVVKISRCARNELDLLSGGGSTYVWNLRSVWLFLVLLSFFDWRPDRTEHYETHKIAQNDALSLEISHFGGFVNIQIYLA